MKAFLVVSVVCVVAFSTVSGQQLSEEQKKRIIQNREDCIKETQVNATLIDKADEGDFTDDDEKLKCFTKCFYQKAGFVNEKGEIQEDVIKAKIPVEADREMALKIVEVCKQKGSDPCDTVYKVHKCYFEYTHHPELVKQLQENGAKTTEQTTEAQTTQKPKEEKKA